MPRVPECEKLFKFALEVVTAGLPLPQSSPRVLLCTCPPLCAGALWPMPAWVWRDVHFFIIFLPCCSIITVLHQCTRVQRRYANHHPGATGT